MERITSFPKSSSEIRLRHKQLRQAMTAQEVRVASVSICNKLSNASWYEEMTWLYGYYPLGNEADCRAFLCRALSDGKRVALPRMERSTVENGHDCRMDFYEVSSLEQVQTGGFGVLEPLESCPLVQETKAVVLVPGVVFDKSGNRYGYGKGYYDRYFARFPELYKVGIAYTHQVEDELAVTPLDIKMDDIYTE